MIGGTGSITYQLTSVYAANTNALADALAKLASGKKFNSAADDFYSFIKSRNVLSDIAGYENVKENLTSFKTFSSAALQVASTVYDNLSKMKDLAVQYIGTNDATLKSEYKADFDALKTEVTNALDNTYVDGVKITVKNTDVKIVELDPDGNGKLKMNFLDIANSTNIGNFDITHTATIVNDVQTEIDSMLTYLSQAKSFDNITSQQINLTDTIINSKKAVESLISDIDEAEQTGKIVDLSIRQQASVALMSQANMIQSAISKLYDFRS